MRIVHFHFGTDGGSERFLVRLANALFERGIEQEAFLRPKQRWHRLLPPALRIHEGVHRRFPITHLVMTWRLKRVADRFRPDVLMAWMTRAARMMPNRPDVLRVLRLGDYPTGLKDFRNIDLIVCNTPDIARHVRDLGWTRGLEVVSNFSDPPSGECAARAAYDTPAGAFLVVAAGRFVRRKGFHTLINAVARIPGCHLWLCGAGNEEEALKAQAAASGAGGRIRFLGWQSSVTPYLRAADAMVMPSSHEPLGNVILEGWATETPVIASKAEGPTWLVEDGVDGLLFGIDDVDALAAAIARLKDDPALRARLAEAGARTLEARFSREAIVDRYLDIFRRESAARRASSPPPGAAT